MTSEPILPPGSLDSANGKLSRRDFLKWALGGGIGLFASGTLLGIALRHFFGPFLPPQEPKNVPPNRETLTEEILAKHTHENARKEKILTLTADGKNVGQRILDVAEKGVDIEIPSAHPAVLLELQFIKRIGSVDAETKQRLIQAYAKGIVNGLKNTYSPTETTVIALDLGHQSFPSERAKQTAAANHKIVTLDNGTQFETTTEKGLNLDVGRAIEAEIANQKLPFIPVLVADQEGFENGALHVVSPQDIAVVGKADINVPLLHYWELLAQELQQNKINMVRLCIHFNSPPANADPDMHGGNVYTQGYGNFAAESKRLGENIATAVGSEVIKVDNGYTIKPEENTAAIGDQSWHLAAGPNSVANRVMNWLTAEAHNSPHDTWDGLMSKLRHL